ncbi:hypothetical protein Stsp02_69490 [Streptomyces sp. NBRC 14336]|nr:hypothetical protein Stsp02_69490 [Streptomyces sp. NBRC 14336]
MGIPRSVRPGAAVRQADALRRRLSTSATAPATTADTARAGIHREAMAEVILRPPTTARRGPAQHAAQAAIAAAPVPHVPQRD